MAEYTRPSGAGPRRDRTLADAETQALSGQPAAAPKAAPAVPAQPSLMDRIKSAFTRSNPDNSTPESAKHAAGSRGM